MLAEEGEKRGSVAGIEIWNSEKRLGNSGDIIPILFILCNPHSRLTLGKIPVMRDQAKIFTPKHSASSAKNCK